MDVDTARVRSRTYRELAECFAGPEEGLEADYARLFVGPGRPVSQPYESAHREGQMMGDCTLAVRSLYAEEGLAAAANLLPDHVAVEFEFMAHLAHEEAAAWAGGDLDSAEICLRREEAFLREHLGRWLPDFCQMVLAGEPHPFYANLAHQAWDHVARDLAQLSRWRLGTDAVSVEAGCSWIVTVTEECTLCGSCVERCEPRALCLIGAGDTSRLTVAPRQCDGCCACELWCPERAITVERANRHQDELVVLRTSPMAVCPGCGAPSVPASLSQRVRERLATDDEGLRRTLTMCSRCKAISGGTSPTEEDR